MSSKATKSLSISSIESFPRVVEHNKRFLHSDSSVSYQTGNLPSNIGNDSIKEIISRSVSYMNEDDDSYTSKSFIHGVILVTIMITSLVAFICSKVRRCSFYVDIQNYENCSKYFLFYSIMTITSCLVTFLIYFLHLIAQCDIMCINKRKYALEILVISIVAVLLSISSICYMTYTDIFTETFTLTSFIFTSISIILYFVRIFFLFYEKSSKRRKFQRQSTRSYPRRSLTKPPSVSYDNGTTSQPKVISYVRNIQNMKNLLMSDDIDDEVFIQ